jgi:hypothetical protein
MFTSSNFCGVIHDLRDADDPEINHHQISENAIDRIKEKPLKTDCFPCWL